MSEYKETIIPSGPDSRLRRLSPAMALAWSESLANSFDESAPPTLALWRPRGTTAALGLSQNPQAELDADAMRRDGVGLVRRQSGGGAVLLYEGVLCWEAVAPLAAMEKRGGPEASGIRQAYTFCTAPVVAGLAQLGVQAFAAGICDVSTSWNHGLEIRKLAGTAQLRRRQAVLVHGSLLVNADVDMLARYLRMPGDQPEYRRGRGHRDFCLTVAEALKMGATEGEELFSTLADAISRAAGALGWDNAVVPARLEGEAAALERDKYRSDSWNWEKKRQ